MCGGSFRVEGMVAVSRAVALGALALAAAQPNADDAPPPPPPTPAVDAPAAALDDAPKCGYPEGWSCPDHQSCAALDGCAYFGSRAADVLSPWSRRPR